MPVFSENTINEVRARTDIVDVISQYVSLEKKGKEFKGVCPFHDDHDPSMSVSPDKQIFHCSVWGKSCSSKMPETS
ncbi:CHC2 zinc finger domain-containing protein, partial [uncultured Faecalibaculum sp.]|uniref:CHC2 zinc finger domain-containing protein n=1 Tax=uncultured Faecalibaculum sp. TaxID=1729681 RepID=UPI00272DB67B